jgi:hypothetical protein
VESWGCWSPPPICFWRWKSEVGGEGTGDLVVVRVDTVEVKHLPI